MQTQNTSKKNIQWGIIGCGDVTEVKSGPAFNLVANSILIAVMRRNQQKAADYAKRHQVPYWFDDANKLIAHPEVNAIYIATPPKYHEEYVLAAINAGKSVYVEKPMSTHVAACKRMNEAADKAGVKFCVAHYRRALPKFNEIKKILDSKRIGDIRAVNITTFKSALFPPVTKSWRVNPDIAGAGLFYDLAPHQLDLVNWFFGDVISSHGYAAKQAHLYDAEDIVTGIAMLENKILFTGNWCFTVAKEQEKDCFEIIGAKGKISFSVFGNDLTIETNNDTELLNFEPPQHIQQPMIEKVVKYFLDDQSNNPCSATEAIKSMGMMEQFVYGNVVERR
jgi:hypothetical protein